MINRANENNLFDMITNEDYINAISLFYLEVKKFKQQNNPTFFELLVKNDSSENRTTFKHNGVFVLRACKNTKNGKTVGKTFIYSKLTDGVFKIICQTSNEIVTISLNENTNLDPIKETIHPNTESNNNKTKKVLKNIKLLENSFLTKCEYSPVFNIKNDL